MPLMTVGDMAQSLILSRQSLNLKTAMQKLSTEATTGLVSDQTERLRGNYGPIAGIEASLTQLDSFHSVTSETQVIAGVMQTALGSIADQSSTLSSALLSGALSTSTLQIAAVGNEAVHRLDTVMSALNTRLGERSLFSGQESDVAAVASPGAMLTALEGVITTAGAATAAEVETAVSAWFDDPAGYAATVYQGGVPLGPVPVGPDQTAQIDVTALDPAILQTLKAMSMAALLGRGLLFGSDVARADLAKRAGEALAGSQSTIAQLGARLGTTEATLANAATRNEAEKDVLQTARLNLLSVDSYETAARFQETQGQLQTLYALTARASRLSLVDFL